MNYQDYIKEIEEAANHKERENIMEKAVEDLEIDVIQLSKLNDLVDDFYFGRRF